MMDWNIVQTFEAAVEIRRAVLETLPDGNDLKTRLLRAFKEISTQEDRLKLVQFAESLVDPIWDY
jgi:hypothetical protein